MFFGYPYFNCAMCGILTDEWAHIVETNEAGKPEHKLICFDCCDKLEELEKDEAKRVIENNG